MENLVMNPLSSYQNKRVFLTGHTGFKGSWITACLEKLGAEVKGYALAPEYEGGLYDLLVSSSSLQTVIADIRDKKRLQEELVSFEPDFIFHLAAQPLVRRSYQIPAETFEVNVVGTANLLEALIQLKKKCAVVVITTDKVYENKEENILYSEDDVLGGYDPYSASKACAEIAVSSFRNSFFNSKNYSTHQKALASARAGNVIGGGDWSRDRIFPDIIRSLQNQEEISVRNPDAIRPWQHVLEPITGYLLLGALLDAQPLKYGQAYNFGPSPQDHLSVKELVETVIHNWGSGKWKDVSDSSQPHEAGLLKLDISKSKRELNWQPRLNTKEAIKWTVNWYQQSLGDKLSFSYQQIENFLAL
jgi:CDP-glucose 4,6-dehydratase